MNALPILALALLVAPVRAQDAEWLRPVATIDLRVPRVLAGDVAPDGSKIVTVDEHRDVVVHAFEPWRELSRAAVAGTAAIDDVRFDREGAHIVVTMAQWETEPAQVFAVADGARVEGLAPELPAIDATPPPGLAEALAAVEVKFVHAARDGSTAVFRCMGNLGVWRGAKLHWLSRFCNSVALTGDGTHLLVTRTTSVDAYPVAGGAVWSVAVGFTSGGWAAPFGDRAAFVYIDGENFVIADAAARRETARIRIDAFGLQWDAVRLAAVSADGHRVAVTALPHGVREPATYLLDLQRKTATALPLTRCRATFSERGLLLLDGRDGICGVTLEPKFTWVPANGAPGESWVPEMVYANGEPLRDGAEVVHLATVQRPDDAQSELRRCNAADGTVLAKADISDLALDLALAAGHVLVFDMSPADANKALTLRRLDDLAIVASSPLPLAAARTMRTAALAPRVAFVGDDRVVVCDVVPPRDGARENGASHK